MWEFVINLLEVAILFLLFNTKLEKKELSYSYLLQILCLFSQAFLLLILKKFSCSTIFILLFLLEFIFYMVFYSLRISRSHYFFGLSSMPSEPFLQML